MKLSFKPFKPTATYAGQDKARKELNFIQSTEATVKIDQRTRTLFDKWLDKHPDTRTRIKDKPLKDFMIKNSKGKMVCEFEYLVNLDELLKVNDLIPVNKSYSEFTLLELIGQYTGKDWVGFYVTDNDTGDYIGIVTYHKTNPWSKTVNNVAMFKFNTSRTDISGSMFSDVLQIMDHLFEKHDEVCWYAKDHPDNPVIKTYDMYLNHKKREGCVTSRTIIDYKYLTNGPSIKTAKVIKYLVQN
jgi:hypothetical protein